jgi:hypothetical protein
MGDVHFESGRTGSPAEVDQTQYALDCGEMGRPVRSCDEEMSVTFHESTGVLRYTPDPNNLRVVVDPGIADFYRSLIPKWITVNRQMYPPHISVIRKEISPIWTYEMIRYWGKYDGQEVSFRYSNIIHSGKMYYWLNAFSTRLEEIRVELGLPVSSEYTRPPCGFSKCFHITLANVKPL